MLFDSHCHLDFPHFDEDRDAVFARMRQAGVSRILAVAVELEQLPRLQTMAERYEGVWFSAGVHPVHEVHQEPDCAAIVASAGHERCLAIGETGMDFYHDRIAPDVQEARFRAHLQAGKQLQKPVIIHMRDADDAVFSILNDEGVGSAGAIMHCFSSTWASAKKALDLGLMLSFSGNVTFKRNEALRAVLAKTPAESLLLETDAPYLAPVPYRGKRNEPTYVRQVAECAAEVRGVSLPELAAQCTQNTLRCLSIHG